MFELAGMFLGGLGLFLLAVAMITDGLKLSAGEALRAILASSTRTRLRGVLSGALVTAVVQSSSAVTVATIGFVNAGLLSLGQSFGIVYGANIGTTMTGWIVAAVGFSFKVEVFALPLIGAGMLLRLLRPTSRFAAFGEAIAGFGLFFIGIDVLQEAFAAFALSVDVASFAPQGGLGLLLYVLLGFAMTVLTQSSSAAIALTLTAAGGDVLALNAAAAMVIGANVGTTSTAALAVIGATPNARRVAAAHVCFNLLTGGVALLLLPLMLLAVDRGGAALGLAAIPAVALALFHTSFNILGVALMWPLTPWLARFLSRHFGTRAERLALPQYLDRNVLATPDLALRALCMELARVSELVRNRSIEIMSAEAPAREVVEQGMALEQLIDAVETFATDLGASRVPDDRRGELTNGLRINTYLEEVSRLGSALLDARGDVEAVLRPPVLERVTGFQAGIVAFLRNCDPTAPGFSSETLDADYDALREQWHDLKGVLLEAAGRHQLRVGSLNAALEALRGCLRMAEQLAKAAARLRALGVDAPVPPTPADPQPEQREVTGNEGTDGAGEEAEPEPAVETPAEPEPASAQGPQTRGEPGA
ncbi:Na/Pi symporter [Pseudohaliea sp.]|uniref:Na/Pi cotransporter family protein n=1 Tax=Pseudohaliea sp. TaxID=2740289 RepID=UPI0032EDACF3